MNDASPRPLRRRWLSVLLNTIVCLLVVGAAAAAVVKIYRTEPTAEQINATRKSAALVETIVVKRDTYSPRIVVLGSVEPAKSIALSPRINGQVVEVAAGFVPGGMIEKDDVLLRLDRADFENALSVRKSELQQANASLKLEEGRQSLARQELELFGESLQDADRSLVLREPQLDSITAEINVAKAAVERAELDLERTTIHAPFDAQILERNVNVGSQVARGDELGQLVGIDEYWVMAAVPVRSLRWIQFPGEGRPASTVTLRNTDAWGPGAGRQAVVERMIGALDRQSRLARVLISAKDPLGQESSEPPLILDTLIEVEIQGRPIENVVRLDRQYVHDRDTVWVMKSNQLEIRDTEVVYRDPDFAYIRSGLESGDEIVTSTLATVANGVGLRRIEDVDSAPNSEDPNSEDPNSEDPNSEDPNSDDPNSDDPNSDDPNSEDPNSEDPSSEDPSSEDPNAADPNSEDLNSEDLNSEESKAEESKAEESNAVAMPASPVQSKAKPKDDRQAASNDSTSGPAFKSPQPVERQASPAGTPDAPPEDARGTRGPDAKDAGL